MTGEAPSTSRGAQVAGALLVLLALGLLVLGVYRIVEDRDLNASARAEVTGTFVDEGFDSRGRQDICSHEVRYVDGPAGTAVVTSGRECVAEVGDVVTVHYDPADPADAAFDRGRYKWGDLVGISILAAVVGLPGWVLLRPRPTPPAALSGG